MSYVPNFPNMNDFLQSAIEKTNSINEEFENFQQPIEYEDTIFKDLADDIKQSQEQINQRLTSIIEENAKSEKKSNRISVITLVVSIFTLIATVIGIVIQIL